MSASCPSITRRGAERQERLGAGGLGEAPSPRQGDHTQAELDHGSRIVRSDWRWKPTVGGLGLVWRSQRGRRQTFAFLTGAQTTGGQVVLRGASQPGANPFKARIIRVDDGIWTVEPLE